MAIHALSIGVDCLFELVIGGVLIVLDAVRPIEPRLLLPGNLRIAINAAHHPTGRGACGLVVTPGAHAHDVGDALAQRRSLDAGQTSTNLARYDRVGKLVPHDVSHAGKDVLAVFAGARPRDVEAPVSPIPRGIGRTFNHPTWVVVDIRINGKGSSLAVIGASSEHVAIEGGRLVHGSDGRDTLLGSAALLASHDRTGGGLVGWIPVLNLVGAVLCGLNGDLDLVIRIPIEG